MLDNPIKLSKKEQRKQLIAFVIIVILFFVGLRSVKIRKQLNIRSSECSGIIASYEYGGGRSGYYFYTDKGIRIVGYYFFKEDLPDNLAIGDSIYKAPDSFRLYIYKKDSEGKYVFDRLAQIHDDSISPYVPL